MKLKTTTIRLTCKLSQSDLAEKGGELAKAELEYTAVEAEKAETVKRYKDRLDAIAGKIGSLSLVIDAGEEERDVEVRIFPDLSSGAIKYLALDRDEVLKERPMTPDEVQGDLPIGEEEAAPPVDAGSTL